MFPHPFNVSPLHGTHYLAGERRGNKFFPMKDYHINVTGVIVVPFNSLRVKIRSLKLLRVSFENNHR